MSYPFKVCRRECHRLCGLATYFLSHPAWMLSQACSMGQRDYCSQRDKVSFYEPAFISVLGMDEDLLCLVSELENNQPSWTWKINVFYLLHKKCIHGSQKFHGGFNGSVKYFVWNCPRDRIHWAIKCIANHYKNSCSRSNHSPFLKTRYSYFNRTQKWFGKSLRHRGVEREEEIEYFKLPRRFKLLVTHSIAWTLKCMEFSQNHGGFQGNRCIMDNK